MSRPERFNAWAALMRIVRDAWNAGRAGWVSPEQHAEVVRERDEARALAAEAVQAEESATAVARKNQATIIDRQGAELRTLRAQLAEVTAQAAVMREALFRVGKFITRPDAPYRIIIDRALASDAGRLYVERTRLLEAVAATARGVMTDHENIPALDYAYDEMTRALAALDAFDKEHAEVRQSSNEDDSTGEV